MYSDSQKGKPFQIYHEVMKAGKQIADSKRKVSWRFGWSEMSAEHECLLSHSITSGKKIVFFDGNEVTTAGGILQRDFSHGWNVEGHFYRVEAKLDTETMDFMYNFSIDGSAFTSWPVTRPNSNINNQYNNGGGGNRARTTSKDAGRKSLSINIKGGNKPDFRPNNVAFSSGNGSTGGGTFDPFASNSDPFSSGGNDNNNNNNGFSADPFAAAESVFTSSNTRSSGSQLAADSHPFGSPKTSESAFETAGFGGSNDENDAFGMVSGGNDPFASGTGGSDPFGSNSSSDPFGSNSSSNNTDAFGVSSGGSNSFASDGGDVFATATRSSSTTSQSQASDPFGDSNAFATSNTSSANSFTDNNITNTNSSNGRSSDPFSDANLARQTGPTKKGMPESDPFAGAGDVFGAITTSTTTSDTSAGTPFDDSFEATSNAVDFMGDSAATNRNSSNMDNDIFGTSMSDNTTMAATTTTTQDSLLDVEVGPTIPTNLTDNLANLNRGSIASVMSSNASIPSPLTSPLVPRVEKRMSIGTFVSGSDGLVDLSNMSMSDKSKPKNATPSYTGRDSFGGLSSIGAVAPRRTSAGNMIQKVISPQPNNGGQPMMNMSNVNNNHNINSAFGNIQMGGMQVNIASPQVPQMSSQDAIGTMGSPQMRMQMQSPGGMQMGGGGGFFPQQQQQMQGMPGVNLGGSNQMQNISGGMNIMSPPAVGNPSGPQQGMGGMMMAPANMNISNMDTMKNNRNMNNSSFPASNNAQKPAENAFGDLKW